MTPAPDLPASPKPRRARRRVYLPLILLGVLLLAAIGFGVRGTWVDASLKNPATLAEGTVTQLYRQPDGNVVVRCSVVVDAPPSEVWAVVSGYEKHKEFLPYVSKVEATRQADGQLRIEGIAHSRIWGDWPFESTVVESKSPEMGEYSALWDEAKTGPFSVNRGGWTLAPNGANTNQTLLTFTLQVELNDYPNFIVRNIVMDRLHSILKAMRDETHRRKKAAA